MSTTTQAEFYAFQAWGGITVSELFSGQEARDFVEKFHDHKWDGILYSGGAEVKNEYYILQLREREFHAFYDLDEGKN